MGEDPIDDGNSSDDEDEDDLFVADDTLTILSATDEPSRGVSSSPTGMDLDMVSFFYIWEK